MPFTRAVKWSDSSQHPQQHIIKPLLLLKSHSYYTTLMQVTVRFETETLNPQHVTFKIGLDEQKFLRTVDFLQVA